jgi:hypothetical protein
MRRITKGDRIRIERAYGILVDYEQIINENARMPGGNFESSFRDVCEALRRIVYGDDR